MIAGPKWGKLGWRHPVWDMLRFYLSLPHENERAAWLTRLKKERLLSVEGGEAFLVPASLVRLFDAYLTARAACFVEAFQDLRDEADAVAACDALGVSVLRTRTQSKDHHQSSKAIIAAVSQIAAGVCSELNLTINTNPHRRCVWCMAKGFHVSARNIDGAIPSLANPWIIWEIKEYWGKTKGGSKMSDAVYECNLVGRELREFEERAGCRVIHVVFLDGKTQWTARQSDLYRFIDLMNQGIIDHLFVGRQIESEWRSTLQHLLSNR